MSGERYCYWCHEPLPPLPGDASYVDEINHYIHDECHDERDEMNRRRQELERLVCEESLDNLPGEIRDAVTEIFEKRGFARRCPCLYEPEHGFQGYQSHEWDADSDEDVDSYDSRNAIKECELCGGSGEHDPVEDLLAITDDKAAERWVEAHIQRGAGPCDHYVGFPQKDWYYSALGYARKGKGRPRGVMVFNYELMAGGTVSYLEIADRFRPRVQSNLF